MSYAWYPVIMWSCTVNMWGHRIYWRWCLLSHHHQIQLQCKSVYIAHVCAWYCYITISSFLQFQATVVKTSEPNSISILAQIPMYALITAGEIMFSITGLQFAYSQVSTSGVHNDCKHLGRTIIEFSIS